MDAGLMVFPKTTNGKLKIVRSSAFFDHDWYIDTNHDVKKAGVDPALHYLQYGAKEGRDPSKRFSTERYKNDFPEIRVTGENPLVHYARVNHSSTGKLYGNMPRPEPIKTGSSIPRIFHSVWLSGDSVPTPLRLGFESFAKTHPDFEIRKWSLDSIKDDDCGFLHEAIAQKKWAFATDYIRLKALYEFGGIYADGDVAFYKRVDGYLDFDSVFCWENHFAIGPHFLMSKPRNPLIGRLLDIYRGRKLVLGQNLDLTPMPVIVTWLFATELGMRLDGSRQILAGNNLIESEKFFTTSFGDGQCIAEHMYYGGWTDPSHNSYKDSLVDIAREWEQQYDSKYQRRLRLIMPARQQWAYYFLANAEKAFPSLGEVSELETFRSFKNRLLGGSLSSKNKILSEAAKASPLKVISQWHLKPLNKGVEGTFEIKEKHTVTAAVYNSIQRQEHKIDIVLPMYNVEKYLVRCLKSLQMQTYLNFEVLMIDDGSTDNSGLIAQAMSKADSRFRYYRKENGGLGDARNFAIPYLDSDLVTFIDSDDFLETVHLEKLEAKFRQGHDMAICNFRLTMPDGRLTETRELDKFWGEEDPVIHALISNYECYAWNKMYRTETFTQNPNARYSLGWFEDLALTPALICGAKDLSFVSDCTYNYVQRPGSILANARKNLERNIEVFASFNMLKKHEGTVPENYWKLYMEWMAPKHYFYWRIIAILSERSHGERVSFSDVFSRTLNREVPEWAQTPYMEHFTREAPSHAIRSRREDLVRAFQTNDLEFYGQVKGTAEFGL
ncbi:glycosyltransferase [Allorhizobium terrae]|uniref:Glycosyltransferase n=1 Tax=Allorhizobium terrae TaxID=1848972 RepID=A0A4S3ZR62_9HYPH|nr:glycosyltransferase [Allorhizobium terrae]THF48082.1 glycosyltransferase [Allorhizobium terrae]